jgi:cyclophilin family peptidyl-prolyl cis-trans isomerase
LYDDDVDYLDGKHTVNSNIVALSHFFLLMSYEPNYVIWNNLFVSCESLVFGIVAEGFDTLTKINEAYVDNNGRPFKDIGFSIAILIK